MKLRKALCLLLSLVLVISLAACGNTGTNSTISGDTNNSSDDVSSDVNGDDEYDDEDNYDDEDSDDEDSDDSDDDDDWSDDEDDWSDDEDDWSDDEDDWSDDEEGSDDEDSDDSDDSDGDNKTHRPHSSNTGSTTTKFVDTDGDFEYKTVSWEKVNDYVIVYPAGNKMLKKSAEALRDYYKSSAKVELAVVADSTKEVAKEILIGKTNRSESNVSLKEGEIQVSVSGKKLVIAGGHDVSVDSAVHKYIRTAPKTGKASTFKLSTDFSTTTFLKDYYYVWGDEFEAEELDMTKWGFRDTMTGTPRSQNSIDRDVIDTGDGRLKLRAIRYFNPEREGTQYKMPQGTTTIDHMSFSYGYAEIRARMPFFRGIWPSYWTKSGDEVSRLYGVYRSEHYYIETDILEVAGNEYGQGGANIHRWFSEGYGTCSKCSEYKYHTSGFSKKNPGSTKLDPFTVSPLETRNETYHTYGWEWTPTKMIMYFDHEPFSIFDISVSDDHCKDVSGFADPQYIIFNLQLTTTDSSNPVGFIEDSLDDLPAEYFLDYFRIYQKKDGKSKIWLNEEYIEYDRK